jgi:hypothetical protein
MASIILIFTQPLHFCGYTKIFPKPLASLPYHCYPIPRTAQRCANINEMSEVLRRER